MRVNITLECTSCHERTYLTSTVHGNKRLHYIGKLSNDHIKELGDRLFLFIFIKKRLHKFTQAVIIKPDTVCYFTIKERS